MALSGTLETFSLPDVLRLLGQTRKTGTLVIVGDRGRGRLQIVDGSIVGGTSDRSPSDDGALDGVVFDLLRFDNGDFHFNDDLADFRDVVEGEGEPRSVDDVLGAAGRLLEQWDEIAAVVPSLDVRVTLVPELAEPVRLTPEDWQVVTRIGAGSDGRDLAGALGIGEFAMCARLRDLVQEEVVIVDSEPVAVEPLEERREPDEVVDLDARLARLLNGPTSSEPVAAVVPVTEEDRASDETADGEIAPSGGVVAPVVPPPDGTPWAVEQLDDDLATTEPSDLPLVPAMPPPPPGRLERFVRGVSGAHSDGAADPSPADVRPVDTHAPAGLSAAPASGHVMTLASDAATDVPNGTEDVRTDDADEAASPGRVDKGLLLRFLETAKG